MGSSRLCAERSGAPGALSAPGPASPDLGAPLDRARGAASHDATTARKSRLEDVGDHVEIVAMCAANSVVVRYVIPDAPTGGGIDATLSVYVDGERRARLRVTSPSTRGTPTGPSPIECTSSRSPRARPEGLLPLTEDCGAVADDEGDDGAAIQRCLDRARGRGSGIWIEHVEVGYWVGLDSPPDGPTDGLVINEVRIRNTFADRVNFRNGTSRPNWCSRTSDIRETMRSRCGRIRRRAPWSKGAPSGGLGALAPEGALVLSRGEGNAGW